MGMIRHKFGAKKAVRDGLTFDSQAEAEYYDYLKAEEEAGRLVGFLRQVAFYLPGKVRYVVDFQEFWLDGSVRFVDVKGMETESFRAKKRMVEALYPWIGCITIVKKKGKKFVVQQTPDGADADCGEP